MPSRRTVSVFSLAIALSACGGASVSLQPKELAFTRIRAHWRYQQAQKTYVVRTEAQWQSAWQEHDPATLPPTERPRVDFGTSMVVGVTLGTAPNGCHGLSIQRAVEDECEIVVQYVYSEPPSGSLVLCTQAIVTLTDFVILARSDKPVVFSRSVR